MFVVVVVVFVIVVVIFIIISNRQYVSILHCLESRGWLKQTDHPPHK